MDPNKGALSATIVNISKEINSPTIIDRSVKYEKGVIIERPPDNMTVLESKLEWLIEQKDEFQVAEVVAQGTTIWTINRRSIPVGIYQINFTASYTVETSSGNEVLEATDYGYIKVIKAPLFAVVDAGTSVLWGLKVVSSVNGSMSYDGDVGLESNEGLQFSWYCRRSDEIDFSSDCYSSFIDGSTSPVVTIDPIRLHVKETYVLRLTVSADDRSSSAEMDINTESGELPLLFLR